MRKLRYAFALLLGFALSHAAFAQTFNPAQLQVQENIAHMLDIARNDTLSDTQKIQDIEQYASKYLDYQRISALAVGRPWREFTPQQQQAFTVAFKNMIINLYSKTMLAGAKKTQVRMLDKVADKGRGKVDVFASITNPEGGTVEISYALYPASDAYKVYDVRLNGISLVAVYRPQIAELIEQKGIDGAIEEIGRKGLADGK